MYLRGLALCAPLAAVLYNPSPVVLTGAAGAGVDFAAGALLQATKPCGDEWYNPDEYVCHDGNLCPVVNGEPLSRCGRACFSQFMYTCTNGSDLQLRPTLTRGRISLRAVNPQDSASRRRGGRDSSPPPLPPYGAKQPPVDGQPMTACRLAWNVGGITCSYCPSPPVEPSHCPAGNVTALFAGANAMDVVVPGGQAFFLTAAWTVGYTQAHSATQPPGSTTAGFRAFGGGGGGGFFNLLDGGWGWAACGRGEQRVLHVRNSTNGEELRGCVGLNLRVEQRDGEDSAAWQYS